MIIHHHTLHRQYNRSLLNLESYLCLSLSEYEQMSSSKPKWLITFEMETSARSLEIIRIFDHSKFNYQPNAIIWDNSLNESFTWQIDEMSLWWIKPLKWMWTNCICVLWSFTRTRFNGTLSFTCHRHCWRKFFISLNLLKHDNILQNVLDSSSLFLRKFSCLVWKQFDITLSLSLLNVPFSTYDTWQVKCITINFNRIDFSLNVFQKRRYFAWDSNISICGVKWNVCISNYLENHSISWVHCQVTCDVN